MICAIESFTETAAILRTVHYQFRDMYKLHTAMR